MAVPMLVPLSAISKFFEKIDADPDWFPGKKAQTRITHRHMQLLYCLVFWQQLLGESIVGAGNIRSTNPDVSVLENIGRAIVGLVTALAASINIWAPD